MTSDFIVRYLEAQEYDLWDRFVDDSQHGSIYSQSYFLEALCGVFGMQFRILTVFKNDELEGGIGLLYSSSKYGDMISPPPLQYYNGLVIKDFESRYPSITTSRQAGVIHAIINEIESGKYASAHFSSRYTFDDPRILLWRGWQIWPRYTYVVPISDLKRQWDRVEQNLRRLISRCEREEMTLEISDDADAFYTMNQATYRRKGIEPYVNREKFTTLYQKLKQRDACQIYFALTNNGRRAAGQLVLVSEHPVTHTWMAGSDPEFLRSGASAFLRWKVFEDLSKRGYVYNDLTDAMNENVAKFKSQFGGILVPSFVIYKEISSKLRTRNRIDSLLMKPVNLVRSRLLRRPKIEDASLDE